MSSRHSGRRQTLKAGQASEQTLTQESVEITSPYPPPSFLSEYERIHPGSAERLMRMAEAQQQLEHEIAKANMQEVRRVNDANIAQQVHQQQMFSRGQIFGLLSVAGVLLFSAYALWLGFPWVAGTSVTTSMLGIAMIYVLRQKPQSGGKQ